MDWDKLEKLAENFDNWFLIVKERYYFILLEIAFFIKISRLVLIPLFLFISAFPKPYFFTIYCSLLGTVYFNKDFFYGQSPAKYFEGFKVVKIKNHQEANKFRLFVRNLTVLCWPLEIIVILFSPYRRLGDYLAGTRLIRTEPQPDGNFWYFITSYSWEWLDKIVFIINMLIAILISIIFTYFILM